MSEIKDEDNHEQQFKEQVNESILSHLEQEKHHYIVYGINDARGMSNFDCEWIDHEDSHQNEVSFNNMERFNKSLSYFMHEESCISMESNVREKNANILGEDLQLFNDSKEIDLSKDGFEKCSNNHENLFDGENNMISQIQPHQSFLNSSINQQEKTESNQHNQKTCFDGDKKKFSVQINAVQQKQVPINKCVEEQKSTVKQDSHTESSTEKYSTVVINQNTFLSKIHEDFSSFDQSKLLKSMIHYLQTNQTSYRPYYILLQTLYSNSKIKSEKSMDNFNMYGDFFKQKTKQLEKFLRQAQSPKTQQLFQNLKTNEINNLAYVDTQVVLREIHEKNIKKVKLYRAFYKQIQEISIDFKALISQVYERRRNLEKQIANCLSSIKLLQTELEKIIEYRVNHERMKSDPQFNIAAKQLFKVQNPHVAKDQYLQIKVIIQKESIYISKLKQLRGEVIKYITLIFLTDEILVSAKIKENLINYTQLLIEVEKVEKLNYQNSTDSSETECKELDGLQRKKNLLNQMKIHQELKIQLTKRLYECVPQHLKDQIGLYEFDLKLTVQEILQSINSHFQNQVFFPSIQLDSQFIFYASEGSWISRDQYRQIQESKMDSKQIVNNIKTDIYLKFILTVNKYLHMEQNDKIATLKLNEIKISKKGKYLIISDRGKGIVGFLVNNGNQLGRIKFKSLQQSDQFAQKLRQLVQQN